jgi:N-acyl-D-amino-acid deacylase
LTWAGAESSARQAAIRDLVVTQRADGGWAQLPSLTSDAYSTGEALVALAEAGMRPDEAVYRRGVEYLLRTQLTDGSCFVHTRSLPTQVYFESGFPHGVHQFISAAASNWATLALIRSVARR